MKNTLPFSQTFSRSVRMIALASLALSLAVCAQAQTLNYFADFNGANGWEPYASVTQATDGNFYGTATNGIYGGGGNMFRMTPTGEITSFYKFCSQPNCADGGGVVSAPVLGSDGNLYGVTTGGGNGNCGPGGVVYRMTLDAQITVLYNFSATCIDGSNPNGIILASDGSFYGTTVYGGDAANQPGTIFKITPAGRYTLLYSFCAEAGCADGEKPFFGPVEGNDGNFYGVTNSGGKLGGVVFYKLTASGKYSVIYNFCSFQSNSCSVSDGAYPNAITKDAQGNFVGTAIGGASGYGVIFKITPSGHYSVLHSIPPEDLGTPETPLTLASDGNLYGTFDGSGSGSWGPVAKGGIFEVSSEGEFKGYGFCTGCDSTAGTTNGFNPLDPVFQGTDGNFYGTTAYGGIGGSKGGGGGDIGFGTVFQFSNGLSPLVETVPVAGKLGQSVIILGYGLTGTTSVTFNGVAADFTVESDTYIRATVPAGATTGMVSVDTPAGTLKSNPQFLVTK
jgi:uncharacterized repeat protein (TIGR03803 family)